MIPSDDDWTLDEDDREKPHDVDCNCEACEQAADDFYADRALNWQRENGDAR